MVGRLKMIVMEYMANKSLDSYLRVSFLSTISCLYAVFDHFAKIML